MVKKFTLVELAIVAGCVAVMASLTAPMTMRARESARRAMCASNLRQSILGMQLYGQENDGWASLYMSGYLAWWQMPGMSAKLGFDSTEAAIVWPRNRKVTACPLDWESANQWPMNISYGVPRWRNETVADYESEGFEFITDNTSPGCYVLRLDKISHPHNYALMADVVYGPQFLGTATPQQAGVGCCIFYRRNSNFSLIAKRHLGIGNVGYADGHVGTTEDRSALWNYSKIGSLVSADGSSVESFFD